ncbi:MAG: glycosyltransferase family 2 protein [Alphaproteobacteria bacterium]
MSGDAELAVCAIFRDEAPYLAEWLAFHRLVGVERFFLYDNRSTDRWLEAIEQSGCADIVTMTPWPFEPGQGPAYQHCLQTHGARARWIAFIDCDEFLFVTDGGDLRAALQPYASHPALAVNWLEYGSSGLRRRPDGPVTRHYTRRGPIDVVIGAPGLERAPGLDPNDPASYRPQFTHIKSVVQPARTLRPLTPHAFAYRDGARAVTEEGRPVEGSWSDQVSVQRFRINHYWSKSLEELAAKVARGFATGAKLSLSTAQAKERLLNEEIDTAIFPIARRLPGWRL